MVNINDIDDNFLFQLFELMDERNAKLGLARYDVRDYMSHPFYLKLRKTAPKPIEYLFRMPDVVAPLLLRKILKIEKKLIPTSLYHLGMSFLLMGKLKKNSSFLEESLNYCKVGLDIAIDAPYLCWKHPYKHHGYQWKDESEPKFNSCAHHTSRMGIFLDNIEKAFPEKDFINKSISTAKALLNYHNWHYYSNTCTVSYYPNTEDEVINTGAEVAALMAKTKKTSDTQRHLEGLVRTLVQEQLADGGWNYCTEHHYNKLGGKPVVDNAHNAMIMGALADIIDSDRLDEQLYNKTIKVLDKSVGFYFNSFVSSHGKVTKYPNRKEKTGALYDYCEGIIALCKTIRQTDVIDNKQSHELLENIIKKILKRAIEKFVDLKTGDVASDRYFKINYNVQSIRVGSGLLMETISQYLLTKQLLEEEKS
ncbi:hypothetical protein [Acetohalobium arabaticum]|uniref:Squalene cyclase C-terminal domain-containing protein n=1 Tax=Acetohalobium arabaticum (strain ATCC 49924 / DSM 5501 / Z-7288) TaxID=574087 RepID=D9QTB2_ACEAZ|nr:hypothetical protein [Acetohalobium arabaticum]ADL13612.1 hypothetical protein Acear_2123 [Acetohalobium arabaticum DSM 5501]